MPGPSHPISVVCSDLSENCLGRAQVLAEVLAAFAPVRIVGPQLGAGIWRPAASSTLVMSGLPMKSAFGYVKARGWLRSQLAGSRVVVSKPRSSSFGLALAAGVSPEQMLLDIDDWELGFMKPAAPSGAKAWWSRNVQLLAPKSLNSYGGIRLLDSASARVPRRSVSNSWLQQRFGGVVLPHVRDTAKLDPLRYVEAARARRAEQRMDGRPWVAFIGTIREHKGVDDLLRAVARLSGEAAPGLLLAGVDFEHAFSKALLAEAQASLPESRLRVVGAFAGSDLPGWVAAADVLCIPSRDIPGAWGQIPAKLFDAMAMARPIVASDVNDMGRILDGCGLVFPAGDVAALSARLSELALNPELGARLGAQARLRAIQEYSVESGQRSMGELIAGVPVFLPPR